MQPANLKRQRQRTVNEIPPDQDQGDRQEVRAHDLDPGLVRARWREALPSAHARFGEQWFKNVLQNPQIRIDVRAVEI